MAGPPRILLRLDDATIIGRASALGGTGDAPVHATVDQVFALGKLTQAEVDRLQRIVDRLKSQGVKFPEPAQAPQLQPPPAKRPRQDGHADYAVGAPPVSGWVAKCMDVLNKIGTELREFKPAFWNAIDRNAVPNYYQIVTHPIFLGEIEAKLKNGVYRYPSEFAADVRQHWRNVKLFNQKGNIYRSVGDKTEALFEQWWAATGYSTERGKRATAGQHAPKFDPERFDAPAKPKTTRSQGGARRANGMSRADAPISEERKQQIAAFLSDLPEEYNEHFMSLLPQELLAGMESGELELDFENLDQVTLRKIDAWLREIRPELDAELPPEAGGPGGSPTLVSNNPSVRVDSFDDDEDYAGETEEESD